MGLSVPLAKPKYLATWPPYKGPRLHAASPSEDAVSTYGKQGSLLVVLITVHSQSRPGLPPSCVSIFNQSIRLFPFDPIALAGPLEEVLISCANMAVKDARILASQVYSGLTGKPKAHTNTQKRKGRRRIRFFPVR